MSYRNRIYPYPQDNVRIYYRQPAHGVDWECMYGDTLNDLHPIFAASNFQGLDHTMLLPALGLASRLLDTDCLLGFWTTMFLGKERRVWHGHGPEDWHWAVFYESDSESQRTKAPTRQKLMQLSENVSFAKASRGGPQDFNGRAASLDYVIIDGRQRPGSPVHGYASRIELSRRVLANLEDSYGIDTEAHFRMQHTLAMVFVHELAHAADSLAGRGTRERRKCHFENSSVYEHGECPGEEAASPCY